MTKTWQQYEAGKEYKRRIGLYEKTRANERFYRGDSSRSSRGGFGIGLSMAAAIVAAHRGRISAECVDGVLTVTVLLPTDS